jgi:ATP-dependent Clp protease ATP-binding subunit ClpA
MGVTKQAAQKRFVQRPAADAAALDPNAGFSRFTPRARNVVVAAQNEARARRDQQIRVEHLVLGLLAEPEGLAARAIVAQGVSPDRVREVATATLGPSRTGESPELVPFDDRARAVLETTFREALRLGHNYIGTEHLLLALLDADAGTGVLAGVGVDRARAEEFVTRTLAAMAEATGRP